MDKKLSDKNYNEMFSVVKKEINKLDPMNLCPGEICPEDEYSQEIEMILSEIKQIKNEGELAKKISYIFNRMFGENFQTEDFYDCAKNILKCL